MWTKRRVVPESACFVEEVRTERRRCGFSTSFSTSVSLTSPRSRTGFSGVCSTGSSPLGTSPPGPDPSGVKSTFPRRDVYLGLSEGFLRRQGTERFFA